MNEASPIPLRTTETNSAATPFAWLAALYQRARIWTVGSDPGLLRLRMASRTTAALACSLVALYLLTRATGQPLTVALLGVVITMIAARSVTEPDPRQQRITMALLPLPAALSITAAALLARHQVAADLVFVVIVFVAVYIRRFDARGRALGMVAFMAYFFTLYLRAGPAELPWMIGAVLVGTLCTFVMSTYVLPDRPERVLRATIRSLRARMAIVVDTTAEAIRAGRLDQRRRRRMHTRIARLNSTALMVQSQIEDKYNPATLWPGVSGEHLAPWLFDAELAVEWVAIAGQRVALNGARVPADTRIELAGALTQLAWAIRVPEPQGLRGQPAELKRCWTTNPVRPQPLNTTKAPSFAALPWRSSRRPMPPPKSGPWSSTPSTPDTANPPNPPIPRHSRMRWTPMINPPAGCCRRLGRPSRFPLPPHLQSSPASWCRRRAGIGR